MSAVDSERAPLAERVGEDANNVLLLAPPMGPDADDGCVDLLSVAPPAEVDVLYLTFVHSPDKRLDTWRSRVGNELPARLGFVAVDDPARTAAAATAGGAAPAGDVHVETVSSPGNLTDIGIKLSTFLGDWEADGNRTALCFHSLTALLQYADLQRAYRFLHVLTGRVRATDGFAHYHMDPSAHDARTRNTLTTLFDAVAEREGDGWSVEHR